MTGNDAVPSARRMTVHASGMETEARHFIIAGAQRSGTTVLAEMLSKHPQISMASPLFPEPKYFLPEKRQAYSRKEYLELFFKDRNSADILGEKTVSYFESTGAAELIRKHLPEARLIFLLRDPVVRAVSNYHYTFKHGLESRSLEEAFADLKDRQSESGFAGLSASPYAYLNRGHYAERLEPFEKLFGRKNMLILIWEPWIKNEMPLGSLLKFLNADPSVEKAMKKGLSWKPSLTSEVLSADLRLRLGQYFKEMNRTLAARYALDVSAWTA